MQMIRKATEQIVRFRLRRLYFGGALLLADYFHRCVRQLCVGSPGRCHRFSLEDNIEFRLCGTFAYRRAMGGDFPIDLINERPSRTRRLRVDLHL